MACRTLQPNTISIPPQIARHDSRRVSVDQISQTPVLRPGDILLTYCDKKTASLSYRVTQIAQRLYDLPLQSFGDRGNPDLVHAAVCIRSAPKGKTQSAQVAEARLASPGGTLIDTIRPGRHKVYRLRNRQIGLLFADIAQRWAKDCSIRYSIFRAAKSIFGSTAVTAGSRALVNKHASELDGDKPSWSIHSAFCSQFALAALQKALYQAEDFAGLDALAVNALHVSPRVLDHLLLKEPTLFHEIGEFIA